MAEDFLQHMATLSAARAAEAHGRRAELEALAAARPAPVPLRLSAEGFDLIAEIKRASPSVGALADLEADEEQVRGLVRRQAEAYVSGGAAALSVLTEPARFKGELAHLSAAVEVAGARAPVMRKDFLVDPIQLLEARAAGASGALLITRMLDEAALSEMLDLAAELGLFVLLEAFDAEDLRRAQDRGRAPGADHPGVLLGLNSRDLASLQVDFQRLLQEDLPWPEGGIRVAESGLTEAAHMALMAERGYQLALVGSALMRDADPRATTASFIEAGRRGAGRG